MYMSTLLWIEVGPMKAVMVVRTRISEASEVSTAIVTKVYIAQEEGTHDENQRNRKSPKMKDPSLESHLERLCEQHSQDSIYDLDSLISMI